MSMNFPYPNITAATEKEQLRQIKSYLYQLVNQLNYVFSVLGSDNAGESGSYDKLENTLTTEIQRLNNRINGLVQSETQTTNEEE